MNFDDLICRYQSGESLEALEKISGVGRHSIVRRFKKCGIRVRTRLEAVAKRRRELPINDIAARYAAGEHARSLAADFGVSPSLIRIRLLRHGTVLRNRKEARKNSRLLLDSSDIVRRYLAGEAEHLIAKSLSVSRPVVRRRLIESGVKIRNWSEVHKLKSAQMGKDRRHAMTRAAHDAVRGTKKSFEELVKRAIANEQRCTTYPSETTFRMMLTNILPGIVVVPQKAVGPYNVDLALTESRVAVEIFGGHWHRFGRAAARYRKRMDYILDCGWMPVVVWATKPFADAAANYVVSIHERRCRGESMPREEHVIWSTGDSIPACERNLETGAAKMRFYGGYRARRKDGRFAK